jgi:hypothetical protein
MVQTYMQHQLTRLGVIWVWTLKRVKTRRTYPYLEKSEFEVDTHRESSINLCRASLFQNFFLGMDSIKKGWWSSRKRKGKSKREGEWLLLASSIPIAHCMWKLMMNWGCCGRKWKRAWKSKGKEWVYWLWFSQKWIKTQMNCLVPYHLSRVSVWVPQGCGLVLVSHSLTWEALRNG